MEKEEERRGGGGTKEAGDFSHRQDLMIYPLF